MSRRAVFVPALALALVLAGCGGDGDSDDDATSTTTTEGTATTEATPTTDDGGGDAKPGDDGDDTTTTDAGTSTTEATPTTGGGGGGDAAEFCTAYAALEDADDGGEVSEDPQTPQEYIDGFEFILPYAHDTLDVAPDEIRDDMATLVDAIEQLVDDLADAPDVAAAEALLDQTFNDEQLEAVSDRVDDYYEATCEPDDVEGGAPVPDDPATGQPPATVSVPQ